MSRLALPATITLTLLAGCARMPPSAPAPQATTQPPSDHPDWIALHPDPRRGDWAIHYRLSPHGLTRTQRRTEVVGRSGDRIALRLTLGDDHGRPRHVLRLSVDRLGRVHQARLADGDGAALALSPGHRHHTRLRRPEPLELVSGRQAVREIVVRRGDDGATTVHYLDGGMPFAELVSLTTRRELTPAQLNKLLGRIAVPDDGPRARPAAGAASAIRDGWVLMHWGRGSR